MKIAKIILIIALVLLLLYGAIVGLGAQHRCQVEEKGQELYAQIQSRMDGYPTGALYAGMYYCDGTTEYMLLKNGDKQITATREVGGTALYYMRGKSWILSDEDTLVEVGVAEDPVEDVVKTYIQSLLEDPEVTYSYHVGRGQPLPLWVYSDEKYLMCQRPQYPGLSEVIVSDQGMDGEYVRWAITRSQDDVTLFLFMNDWKWQPDENKREVLFGWGIVKGAVYEAVFA